MLGVCLGWSCVCSLLTLMMFCGFWMLFDLFYGLYMAVGVWHGAVGLLGFGFVLCLVCFVVCLWLRLCGGCVLLCLFL